MTAQGTGKIRVKARDMFNEYRLERIYLSGAIAIRLSGR